MNEENVKRWSAQPDVCRCCLSASGGRDATAAYMSDSGLKEVLADMLLECFGITLSHLSECGRSRLVCARCERRLRDASAFREQVLCAERHFALYCDSETVPEQNSESTQTVLKTELEEDPAVLHDDMQVKQERADHDIELVLIDELYRDHEVKEELVIGPVVLQKPGSSAELVSQDMLATGTHMTNNSILPEKSRKSYDKCYNEFMEWKKQKKATSFSEKVLLAYFQDLSDKFKCSSLWSKYSMIKSTLSIYNEIDITKYSKLIAFLKNKSQGYKGKKAKTFLPGQLSMFLNEAPDKVYLSTKIALIFGIMGACSRQELYNILFEDVEVFQSTILVKIHNSKTKIDRSFTITGKYYKLCKQYIKLRPNPCSNGYFFINYHSGKCTQQRIGINKFGSLGKTIANYLHLPNPQLYTGHCFRRTSATLLVDAGGDIAALKGHSGWKSTAAAEGYLDDSVTNKILVSNSILNRIENSKIEVNIDMPTPVP